MYTPNHFGSPQCLGTVDIKYAKKKQTLIKTATGSFVKLICGWKQDVNQISVLLGNLRNYIFTLESIQRMQCRHPQPCALFEEMYPEMYSLLTGNVFSEIEAVYHQLKHFMYASSSLAISMHSPQSEIFLTYVYESFTF